MRLRALAPAKVNLSLFVGEVRPDGRHELATVFESVSLADELELSTDASTDEVLCPGLDGPNLVARALDGLRTRGWDASPVQVRIRKQIPVAAGMGGGSADAAALLRLARQVQAVPDEVVKELAAELGADVPSQLSPGLAIGSGAGEQIEPRPPIAPHAFAVVPQPYQLSTAEVYAEADRLGLARSRSEISARRGELAAAIAPAIRIPRELLVNDLQPAAVSLRPQLALALEAVAAAGCDDTLVCGSGPTIVGLCWGGDCQERVARVVAGLEVRFPGASTAVPVDGRFGCPLFA